MATRRYKINPSEKEYSITEEVGAAVNSKNIELTIELATNVSGIGGNRTVSKEEVLIALEELSKYITRNIWPPA